MSVDPDRFRSVFGNFATGVTVVTYPSDPPHGITANAVTSVSLDPPLALVCIDHGTKSYELLDGGEVDGFCFNILADDQQHLGEFFADMRDLDPSPFESEPTRTEATGAAIFEESLAYADCRLHDAFPGGDHTIYVGEVEAADTLSDGDALTFFRGDWGRLG